MADIDSNASGATLPPTPSPSTVTPETAGDPLAKIKHLQPTPVTSRVYHAIAEATSGFEKVTEQFHVFEQCNFCDAEIVTAWLNSTRNLQAQVNSHLLEWLHSREMNNANYYDRLCYQWEKEISDPNDVLREAEYRRQELAQQQEQDDSEDS
jgi:hypothetical protein